MWRWAEQKSGSLQCRNRIENVIVFQFVNVLLCILNTQMIRKKCNSIHVCVRVRQLLCAADITKYHILMSYSFLSICFFSILLAFLPIPTTLSISYLYSFHWCKRFLFVFFDEFNDKITLIAIKTLKKEKLKEKRDFHDDNIHRLWKLETFVSQQLLNSLLTVYI